MKSLPESQHEEANIKTFLMEHDIRLHERSPEPEHERMTRIFGFAALNVYNVERRSDGWTVILGWPPNYHGTFEEMRSTTKQLLTDDGISLAEHEPVCVQVGNRYRIGFDSPGGEIGLGIRHDVRGQWVLYGGGSEVRYSVQ